jgi:hypothetical protein
MSDNDMLRIIQDGHDREPGQTPAEYQLRGPDRGPGGSESAPTDIVEQSSDRSRR